MSTVSNTISVKTDDFSVAKRPSLRVNVVWTAAGNFVYGFSQWVILMLFAKLGNPRMVGQYALGLAITAPVYMFCNLSLRTVQATDAQNQYRFSEYFGLRTLCTGVALAVVVAIVAGCRYEAATAVVVLLMAIAKASESLSDVVYGLCQKHERMANISISLCLKGVGSVAVVAVALLVTDSVVAAMLGMACWWTILFVALDLRWASQVIRLEPQHNARVLPGWSKPALQALAVLAFPMGLQTMLNSLTQNLPRYAVDHYLGTEALGRFAAIAYFILAAHNVVAAVGNSTAPRFARAWQNSVKQFRCLALKCSAFAFGMGLVCGSVALVFGHRLLAILYRPEYAANYTAFVIVMFSASFFYVGSILGSAVAAVRQFWAYTITYATVPLATAAASVPLVKHYGMNGAAWVVLVMSVGSAVVPIAILLRAYRRRAALVAGIPF